MKRFLLFFTFIFAATSLSAASVKQPVVDDGSNVMWTAVFSNITPRKPDVSIEYCRAHTPTVIVTTVDTITKKGTKALNGVTIKYLSYKTSHKDGLFFNVVDAVVTGKDTKGKWSTPMKLYEQTLESIGVTYTVWSTPDCKGTFLGTPTVISAASQK